VFSSPSLLEIDVPYPAYTSLCHEFNQKGLWKSDQISLTIEEAEKMTRKVLEL